MSKTPYDILDNLHRQVRALGPGQADGICLFQNNPRKWFGQAMSAYLEGTDRAHVVQWLSKLFAVAGTANAVGTSLLRMPSPQGSLPRKRHIEAAVWSDIAFSEPQACYGTWTMNYWLHSVAMQMAWSMVLE